METPTSSIAARIPSAIRSHLTIPPKIFTRTTFTSGSANINLKALETLSCVAVPPTSRKFAGDPPKYLIVSIVPMAKPAPLTMQPIFPSKET